MSYKRTFAAMALTLIAIAVPSVAWLSGGLEQARREAELKRRNIQSSGHKKAVLLAGGLGERLRLLRGAESRRPFYHYQNLYHDPRGAAEGASVSVSPLAEGPLDPFVQAHFQVDEDGRLTLPTLNDEFPELGLQARDSSQCALLHRLQDVAIFCTRSMWDSGHAGEHSAPRPPVGDGLGIESKLSGDGAQAWEGESTGDLDGHVEVLKLRAWQQHVKANALYADLKYKQPSSAGSRLARPGARDQVTIPVGGFGWHTLPVDGEPSLVALRSVETPEGPWRQGFVVNSKKVREYLEDSFPTAAFLPLSELGKRWDPEQDQAVGIEIDNTGWGLRLDLAASLAAAEGAAARSKSRFLRIFLLSVLAGIFAGTLVVAMVYQSERLAAQRVQFAAHAAHELRTPLAGLRLYSEMLAEGLGDPAKSRSYAQRLAQEAERLGRVVTNVLSFTRLERRSLNLHPELADLGQAVRDVVARQLPALEQAGARLDLRLQEELPEVCFDRDALGHILQNLLDNAEKYTREIPGRKILVSLEEGLQAVVLKVADNGRGIAENFRKRLFRPFTRGDAVEGPEGVGLGLVLARALAEAQGATIQYSDAPEGGAVFTVTFPLSL